MSFIGLGSLRSTRVYLNLEKVFTERLKNLYASRSACLFALRKVQVENGSTEGVSETVTSEDEGDDLDPKKPWLPRPEPYLLWIGDMACDVYIEDEGGKINLNTINDENRGLFADFLISKDIDHKDADIITDSILDWIDKDELHHINGAETPYYESLPEPYKAKNGQFDSIEELILVKGVTPLIFDKIRNDITVYGTDKININFATKEVLLSVPGIDEEMADELLMYIKENGPIKDYEELRSIFFTFGIAGAAFEEIKEHLTLEGYNFVTIRSICSSNPPSSEDAIKHGYRLIVEAKGDQTKIMAAYPD